MTGLRISLQRGQKGSFGRGNDKRAIKEHTADQCPDTNPGDAWINSSTGAYAWVDDHSRWIGQRPNAASLGLKQEAISRIESPNPAARGVARVRTLVEAMGVGLIRVSASTDAWILESALPWQTTLKAAAKFLSETSPPEMLISIKEFGSQDRRAAPWSSLQRALEEDPQALAARISTTPNPIPQEAQ